MRRALIGIGLCVALAAPATASGALKTFSGKLNGGGKIGIEADVIDGHAVQVTRLILKRVPAHCSQSGGSLIGAGYTFSGFLVNENNRFKTDSDDGADGHLVFQGTFKRHARRVEGSLTAKPHISGEDCNTGKRHYEIGRGPLPELKSAKALTPLTHK